MRLLLPCLLVLVAGYPACGSDYSARVVGISDGDTITVLTAGKVQHRVRLHGIDAPETGQDFGSRAKRIRDWHPGRRAGRNRTFSLAGRHSKPRPEPSGSLLTRRLPSRKPDRVVASPY
jgi:hypothetical protein